MQSLWGGYSLSLVSSALDLDIGCPCMKKMTSSFCLSSINPASYKQYKKRIGKITSNNYKEIQGKVVKAIFLYYENELSKCPDENGILDIDVSFDGSWMTRGHSPMIGMRVVIDVHAGFVINGHVCSTYCHSWCWWGKVLRQKKIWQPK